MAQPLPYMALKDAPVQIRRATTVAQISSSFTRGLGILFTTLIIATLPTWVPGLLAHQTIPVALLVLAIGTIIVSNKGSRIREEIAERQFQKARSSTFTTAILGFIVGGMLPGILYLYLYTRIGNVMVKQTPDDPKTVYLLPHPSEGIFLGRYLGWIAAYLLVLYIGYTQLSPGLREVSDWLSPVLGVHFNTMIVALFLVFTNPLTYPPLLYLWTFAGFLGGLIAGGKIRRGFLVGMTVYLSTLGALGLAALAIYQNVSLSALSNLPPPPPGFSIISATTGPVAGDIIPILIQGGSPTSQMVIQDIVLTMIRNAGLVFAVATISGRAASLFWQGDVFVLKTFWGMIKTKKPTFPQSTSTGSIPKKGILLLALAILLLIPSYHTGHPSPITQALPSGPYQQNLAIGLDMLGAPNASLRMTNLDLSSRGLVLDDNYAGNNLSIFVIDNNYSQPLGASSSLGIPSFILGLFSQPALITFYTGDPATTRGESDNVASQFSQALGVIFTKAFALPYGPGTITIYAPNPELTNNDALTRVLGLLPSSSFSTLIKPATLQNIHYFAAIGLATISLPPPLNKTPTQAFSFLLNAQFPREFYKAGQHYLSLKTLFGFQTGIVGDTNSNASIVSISFQRGTVLYSSLGQIPPSNPIYNNFTLTYIYNATVTPRADFSANFTYPFAPNITLQKTVTPSSGSLGTSHNIIVMIQNFDNVTVTNLNVTDNQAPSAYQKTLQISPSGVQTGQFASFPPGQTQFLSYTATTQSSGIYVLSSATADFVWQAPNGTKIRYTVTTDKPLISSSSGPWTQFTRTFTDLQPYSYLLLLPLLLTPVIETLKLVGRHRKKNPEPWVNTPAGPQIAPPSQPVPAGPDKPADTPSPANP
ncbi:hypothetical protein E6H19_04165 [Candidatus Bathyarchaeota archaeon]|nr:MAG: hypothetical protein E6H19_04165 [Candidatus Bathyarchaeota archaeon]